jgi:ribosomal protein S27AE
VSLQQLVVQALSSGDLDQDILVETPVDRIGALAFAPALGKSLRHLQAHATSGEWTKATEMLAKETFGDRKLSAIHRKLAEAVMLEREIGSCRKCGGRGVLIADGEVRRTCGSCNGTKRWRHSDAERARSIGVALRVYQKHWERWFTIAHSKLSWASTATDRVVYTQLGRGSQIC